MNPYTGDIFRGDEEFLKTIERRDDVKLIPVTEGKATFVEAMGPQPRKALAKQERERQATSVEAMGAIQRKALAKQERKRLARLEQVEKGQLVSSS